MVSTERKRGYRELPCIFNSDYICILTKKPTQRTWTQCRVEMTPTGEIRITKRSGATGDDMFVLFCRFNLPNQPMFELTHTVMYVCMCCDTDLFVVPTNAAKPSGSTRWEILNRHIYERYSVIAGLWIENGKPGIIRHRTILRPRATMILRNEGAARPVVSHFVLPIYGHD